jgi:hypothetical protein
MKLTRGDNGKFVGRCLEIPPVVVRALKPHISRAKIDTELLKYIRVIVAQENYSTLFWVQITTGI